MSARRHRGKVLLATLVGMAAIAWAALVNSTPRIVYNPSASAARGWYAVVPSSHLRAGDLVLARLPSGIARFAATRGYLPETVPILKRIAAVAGQQVCEQHGIVRIDGAVTARARRHDGAGRPLDSWSGCHALRPDELFFLNLDHEGSFDSRYFGPLDRADVIGKAIPLWTW